MIRASPKQGTEIHEVEWEAFNVLTIFKNDLQEKAENRTTENMVVIKGVFHWPDVMKIVKVWRIK